MTAIIYRTDRVAMRCWCEVFLCGDDRGHLAAVAELALDEITRVEHMLSRFDPTSEVFRLNAAAVDVPFRVSPELLVILVDCREWWKHTAGAFDITVSSTAREATSRWNAIRFDTEHHTVTRTIDGITFDFGGYGKGYAIDRALDVIQQYGITAACLHAGTSSVVASGSPPDVAGWPIAIRHPDDESRTVAEWLLCDAGMSTSATLCAGLPTPHSPLTEGLHDDDNTLSPKWGDLRSDAHAGPGGPHTTTRHDTVDPMRNAALTHPASCTVMAVTATLAEVWSTAMLVQDERGPSTNDVSRVLWQRFVDGNWGTSPHQNTVC